MGGSDDHGMLDVAATWTETPAAEPVYELLDHLRAGRTAPGGEHGATEKLAGAMVSLAAHADAERGGTAIPAALAARRRRPARGRARASWRRPSARSRWRPRWPCPTSAPRATTPPSGRFAERIERRVLRRRAGGPGPVRAVMLTDTYDEINGVAGAMRRLSGFAARARRGGADRRLVRRRGRRGRRATWPCDGSPRLPVPAYGDAAWRLGVPPVRELIDLMERAEVQVVHAATPGPMGLAGLLLARVLGLPFVATYHTELGRYAMDLTGDRLAAGLTERCVRWFYDQAERVYVPSRATGRSLAAAGVDPERMALFTRGVDTGLFDPARRTRGDAPPARRRTGPPCCSTSAASRARRASGCWWSPSGAPSAERPDLTLALVGGGPGRGRRSGGRSRGPGTACSGP